MANHSDVVRQVLLSDTVEHEMKRQMIHVATENLTQNGMPEVLLEALNNEKVSSIKNLLLDLLMSLDSSRFKEPENLYSTLLCLLKNDPAKENRKKITARLVKFLHHDHRIIPSIIESLSDDTISEEEQIDIISALNRVPRIGPETTVLALEKAKHAPTAIQRVALDLALNLPSWNSDIVSSLYPYLEKVVDSSLRSRIIKKLKAVKVLDSGHAPLLVQILQNDQDIELRTTCLELLASIRPTNSDIIIQLFWSAKNDSNKSIRKTALKLQNNIPKLSNLQIKELVIRLYQETDAEVRMRVLENIKNYIRIEQVRETVLACFSEHPNVEQDEFDLVINLLRPYFTRDEKIRDRLLEILPTLPLVEQRKGLIDSIIAATRVELILPDVINIFKDETNDELRSVLFRRLKALSVSKHPSLIDVFSEELKEPSSSFRLECANAISSVSEISSRAKDALEDVLMHDTDRELIRVALKAYMKPNVEKRFDVLIQVAEKETLEIQTRNEAVEEILKLDISVDQKERLSNSLASTRK